LLKVFFGPLMGVNDRKAVSAEEIEEMRELLEEDSLSLGDDAMGQVPADVAMTAGDSVGLSKISK